MARWRRGNAGVCKTPTAPVRFRHAPPDCDLSGGAAAPPTDPEGHNPLFFIRLF